MSSRNVARNTVGRMLGYALAGGLAGIAATYAMDRVTRALMDRQRPAITAKEEAARGGKSAMEIAAEETSLALGRGPLTRPERKRWGQRLHWTTGALAGATYGAISAVRPGDWRQGLLYGAAVFALLDEAVPVALGMPGPGAFPWQTHARGLAGHLTYGLATHAALRALPTPVRPPTPSLRPWSRSFDLRGALRA
ncbi:MAG: DUF1440 domain-containing protein [Myxococcota bacterium]